MNSYSSWEYFKYFQLRQKTPLHCLTTYYIVVTTPSFHPFKKGRGRGWIFEILPKRCLADFYHKKGSVGKIVGDCLIKGGTLSLTFILTNCFQSYLLQSEWWFVFCLFTPYLWILFVPWKESNLIESNQQICDS